MADGRDVALLTCVIAIRPASNDNRPPARVPGTTGVSNWVMGEASKGPVSVRRPVSVIQIEPCHDCHGLPLVVMAMEPEEEHDGVLACCPVGDRDRQVARQDLWKQGQPVLKHGNAGPPHVPGMELGQYLCGLAIIHFVAPSVGIMISCSSLISPCWPVDRLSAAADQSQAPPRRRHGPLPLRGFRRMCRYKPSGDHW